MARYRFRRQHKYRAKQTILNGHKFPSKKEAERYQQLLLLARAGQITELEIQPRFELVAGISYVADFRYKEGDKVVIEDTKGYQTPEFRLKLKLFRHFYPHADLRIL